MFTWKTIARIIITFSALILVGCATSFNPDSVTSGSTSSATDAKIPSDPPAQTQDSPSQWIHNDATSDMLASAVMKTLSYRGMILEDFDDIHQVSQESILEIAMTHTDPFAFYYTYDPENGFVCEDYPDHPVIKLFEEQIKKGNFFTNIYEAEEVRSSAEKIFGTSVSYPDQDTSYFTYFPSEKVYMQRGEWSGSLLYPQILAYSESENQYTCEVVFLDHSSELPLEVKGEAVTKENFSILTRDLPKYQYTFLKTEEDHVILQRFQTNQS